MPGSFGEDTSYIPIPCPNEMKVVVLTFSRINCGLTSIGLLRPWEVITFESLSIINELVEKREHCNPVRLALVFDDTFLDLILFILDLVFIFEQPESIE